MPDGTWSKTRRIGQPGDALQSLRVVDGAIHETVVTEDGTGPVFYGAVRGADSSRIRVPGARETSLRIGDDGHPRIAYTTGNAVGYAVGTGAGLTTATIFSFEDVETESPVLVLGSGDRAFVSWAARHQEIGCEDTPTPTHQGTWFATDIDDRWTTKRLTKKIGSAALVLDVERGRVHAIYDDGRGIRYATRAADGTWSKSRIGVTFDLYGAVLRRDARTGTLLLVASSSGADDDSPGIYAFTAT